MVCAASAAPRFHLVLQFLLVWKREVQQSISLHHLLHHLCQDKCPPQTSWVVVLLSLTLRELRVKVPLEDQGIWMWGFFHLYEEGLISSFLTSQLVTDAPTAPFLPPPIPTSYKVVTSPSPREKSPPDLKSHILSWEPLRHCSRALDTVHRYRKCFFIWSHEGMLSHSLWHFSHFVDRMRWKQNFLMFILQAILAVSKLCG